MTKHAEDTRPSGAKLAIRKVNFGHELLTCSKSGRIMRFRGAQCFRERLIYATLSGRTIHITSIRSMCETPGITESEASLLRLLDVLTNGSHIDINSTGTTVRYKPGFVIGGNGLEHDCHPSRAIGYYLAAVVSLAPFAKRATEIKLRGVTNSANDISVDVFRTVVLPTLKHFGVDQGLELKILKRGAAPLGGGEVSFVCPVVQTLKSIELIDGGKVKRIRGVAYTARVNPSLANRVVDSSRAVFNDFIPDVWIYTDHYKGSDAGKSPGYALSLVSESTNGTLLSAEASGGKDLPPEELGELASKKLLQEISSCCCVDSNCQSLILLYMALCPEDVSRVRFGKLMPLSVQCLRHIRDFFGVSFRLKTDPESETVIASCRGTGFKNLARKALA